MVIPQYKMSLRHIGEVALREKNWNGIGFINKTGKKIEETSVPRNMIININNSGTGFILQKLAQPIYIKNLKVYAIALFVTAAHVVIDVVSSKQKGPLRYPCKIDGITESLSCIFYKSYHDKYPESALGENGASYCVGEGDLALMILLTLNPSIQTSQMNILSTFIELKNFDCLVAGYPSGFDYNPLYNYPYTNDEQTAIDNLKEIFNDSKKLICTPGKIKYAESIIEVTSSSSSGMSGSPVISENMIIGVFVGGPALKGQRALYKAAKALYHNDIKSSWNAFEEYLTFNDLYENDVAFILEHYSEIFTLLGMDCPAGLIASQFSCNLNIRKRFLIASLTDEISELVKTIKNKDEISHNSALPSYQPAFKNLMEDANIFHNFFSSISEINSDVYFDHFN